MKIRTISKASREDIKSAMGPYYKQYKSTARIKKDG
jgi:hypothetical protein